MKIGWNLVKTTSLSFRYKEIVNHTSIVKNYYLLQCLDDFIHLFSPHELSRLSCTGVHISVYIQYPILFISFPLLSAMKIVTSSFLSGIIPVKEKKSHIYNFEMIFKHFFFPSTFPLPIQSQNMSKLTWRSLPIIHNYTKYRKIPKISPVAYIFQRSFLRGLFLKGLIHGGAYFRNFTVSLKTYICP